MTDSCAACSTEVQHLRTGHNMNVVQTVENTSRKLRPERVPHAILRLGALDVTIDRDALLAVDRLSGYEVLRDKQVLLGFGDEDTGVPVWLDDDPRSTLGTPTPPTASSASTSPRAPSSAPSVASSAF